MAGLVGDNPQQFARVFGPRDQSGVEKQILAAGDKRVQVAVIDQIDIHRAGAQAGRLEDWPGHFSDDSLNLRIPDE